MRFDHDFPARSYLNGYPHDFSQFLQRCREMANCGVIRLRNNGHQLSGRYSDLHQFNLKDTRTWGFRDGRLYIVLNAAKKRTTGQGPDYERSLSLLEDYRAGRRES